VFGKIIALLSVFSMLAQPRSLIAAQSGPTKITAGYGGELGYQAPIWVAHELKLIVKYGMTAELVPIAGGARSTAALLTNALQVSQSAVVAPVQANLAGGDLVIIATSTNRPTVSIVGQPKTVKKPQDLLGKTVGLVGPGEMNAFFLNALERWGIDPKSVTVPAIPGTQPRLAAVVAGTIDATVLAPPFSFEAERYNLATQPGGTGAKNAKAEEFFDNSLLQELRKEGFFARLQGGKGL
jgi:ABC-type nitrate/sulfonate/bicarbonate transport system substrate-binding protein